MKRGKVVWLFASYYHKQMTNHCLWLIIIWLWLMRKMSIRDKGFVHGARETVQHQTKIFYFVALKFTGLPDQHIQTNIYAHFEINN
jgi:hypothetical protein